MSARQIIAAYGLAEALEAEGFPLPDECREVRVVMPPDSPIIIQYDVFLTEETLPKLGRALQRMAEREVKDIA